ncbi:MAG TPA: hypothetical protein VFS39_14040 [Nitrospira sp.]|nr:hypothetical protein [Nitrospira sp.]
MHNRNRSWWRLAVWLLVLFGVQQAFAIPREDNTEKEENLKQQASGGLFHRWTFDQPSSEAALGDFSQIGLGEGPTGVWAIAPETQAPSPPHILKAASACQAEFCYRMLVANKLEYEYPDVSVSLRSPGDGKGGQGGIVISVKDSENFYAAIVDLAAKKLDILRVLKGQVTLLGQTPITPKPVEWHSLRIQRDTIISKDVIDAFFDGLLVLSVRDQSLGKGQVGVVVDRNSSLDFDSLHAIPLFSQRPFSAPAAY